MAQAGWTRIFINWAKVRYPQSVKMASLFLEFLLLVILLPYLLIFRLGLYLDAAWGAPSLYFGWPNIVLAIIIGIAGIYFSLWSVIVQVTMGKGTPAPMMPTQKLIVKGPYAYCRNPMVLGFIVYYIGIVVWLGSIVSLGLVAVLCALLLSYFKFIEEKELEARFGASYVEYKRNTPFIIPRLTQKA